MPLLETSQVAEHVESTFIDKVEALNHMILRMTRAVIFRIDDHSPLDEMPISQIRCLNAIGNEEGKKMQEIANRLDIKLPAMSQMVERLVKKGLVERRGDPTDRRVARLYLTDEARKIIEEARHLRLAHLRDAVKQLDPQMLQGLIEDMRVLAEAGERAFALRTGQQNGVTESKSGTESLVDMLSPGHRPKK